MVVLEAMASGVPVVAFDVGGVRELLADGAGGLCGVCVPQGDVAGMVRETSHLLENLSKRERLAQAAQRKVAAYTLEVCSHAHEKAYRAAVAGKSGRV